MKKIYITGIAGLLGNNLANELKNKYTITGVDMVQVDIPGIDYNVFDMTDYAHLKADIEEKRPDILIHTVAVVNVDLCEVNKELANKINAELTKVVTEICRSNRIKLIYISTDAVFDGQGNRLSLETDVVNPQNEYARSKYKGELYARDYEDHLILRTNIYGINVQNKKSFGEWIVDALLKGEKLNMFTDIYFSPILVNELADIIDKSIEVDLKGLYHACGTGMISKYEFGRKVKKIFSIETGIINASTSDSMHFKAPRSKNMGMSNQKICEALKIKIRTPEESIVKFQELYRKKERQEM